MDRTSTCPLTIHALIHLASDTPQSGPLSRIWEYVTERYMGKIARNVTSRRYPVSQIAETVKKQDQMKTVATKFGLEKELFLAGKRRDWSVLGSQETMIPTISKCFCSNPANHTYLFLDDTTVLMTPHQPSYRWTNSERRRVAIYIRQAFELTASAKRIEKVLADVIPQWGKFRVMGERNVVRGAWASDRISGDRLRDSSYVRVSVSQYFACRR